MRAAFERNGTTPPASGLQVREGDAGAALQSQMAEVDRWRTGSAPNPNSVSLAMSLQTRALLFTRQWRREVLFCGPYHVSVDILPATRRLAEINGRRIVVFHFEGKFYPLNNRCPRRDGSLFHGKQTGLVESTEPGDCCYSRPGEIICCPWHRSILV
jgi:nitrite reductase/ring-hydroxylating ferredoxin subunit